MICKQHVTMADDRRSLRSLRALRAAGERMALMQGVRSTVIEGARGRTDPGDGVAFERS
jgi:hypothetical protein